MKRIFDKQRIQAAMDGIGLSQCMQTIDPGILIYEYSPGELVISPLKPAKSILFFLEGHATVYVVDEKETMISAAREMAGGMVGDPELFFENYPSAYIEARTMVRVLALPYDLCLRELRTNEQFTHFLIRQILLRENRKRQIDYTGTNTREKVLFYVRAMCPDQSITSITSVADAVHCSYRQAQRIIRDLTAEGVLLRIGKGMYKLL